MSREAEEHAFPDLFPPEPPSQMCDHYRAKLEKAKPEIDRLRSEGIRRVTDRYAEVEGVDAAVGKLMEALMELATEDYAHARTPAEHYEALQYLRKHFEADPVVLPNRWVALGKAHKALDYVVRMLVGEEKK